MFQGGIWFLRWVDHTDHAGLAVLALCAVEPDRCGSVLDLESVGPVGNLLSVSGGNEATPHAVGQRCARRAEGTLGDRVVLGQNLNDTVSPSAAWMLSGLKTSSPALVPTATEWSTANAVPARAVAAKMVEKCIMIGLKGMRLARCGLECIMGERKSKRLILDWCENRSVDLPEEKICS
jgi:hypothetical protein